MSGKLKKIIFGISIFALLFIVTVELEPFYALYQIKEGVKRQDTAQLASFVDFPTLKANVKAQLEDFLAGQPQTDIKKKPFAAFAMNFASKVVDGMVDAVVSPQGLAALLQGITPSKPWQNQEPKSAEPAKTEAVNNNPKKEVIYRFDSPSQFSVSIMGERDSRVQFIFTRTGLTWKLSNITFPLQS